MLHEWYFVGKKAREAVAGIIGFILIVIAIFAGVIFGTPFLKMTGNFYLGIIVLFVTVGASLFIAFKIIQLICKKLDVEFELQGEPQI